MKLIVFNIQLCDSTITNHTSFKSTNRKRNILFLSMGDRTRNLVSLHIRLVPLPFEPFQHLQNKCEITQGAVAQSLIHYLLNPNCNFCIYKWRYPHLIDKGVRILSMNKIVVPFRTFCM